MKIIVEKDNFILALEIIALILALFIVIVGLLQGKKNHNGLGALSGGNQELFASTKERGWTKLFSIVMLVLAIMIFLVALAIILIETFF